MKKTNVISAALFLMFFALTSFAGNSVYANSSLFSQCQDVSKTAIDVKALPEAVTNALKSSIDEGWAITEAFSIVKDEKTSYQINLKKGEETKTLNISSEGEIIK